MNIEIKLNGKGALYSEPHIRDDFSFRSVWQPIRMRLSPREARRLAIELLTKAEEVEAAEREEMNE